MGFTISRPETTPLPSHALNRKDFMGQQAFMPQLSNKTQHALSQYHHLCCWGCHIWLLFPLHLWPSGSSYDGCSLSLHDQVSQCSQWLPSNRDCACFRLSRSSRWDLTRRWLTSLPYWLSSGMRAWDTINPHSYGSIDCKVEGWRQSSITIAHAAKAVRNGHTRAATTTTKTLPCEWAHDWVNLKVIYQS